MITGFKRDTTLIVVGPRDTRVVLDRDTKGSRLIGHARGVEYRYIATQQSIPGVYARAMYVVGLDMQARGVPQMEFQRGFAPSKPRKKKVSPKQKSLF